MTIRSGTRSRQPPRKPWSLERLIHSRSLALSNALDLSTKSSYSSHLNSYLEFCHIHTFPVEPTEDTFSFYIIYMSHHIEPRSVNSYLSGICNELEVYYPNIRKIRTSRIVSCSLKGCKRMLSNPIKCKRALTTDDLLLVCQSLQSSTHHDDRLFLTQLLTGFHALMRLGELVWPDQTHLRDTRKLSLRHLVDITDSSYSFLLPSHKADAFFEGNRILVHTTLRTPHALPAFTSYLRSRDHLFPCRPELWLQSNGSIPTRSWFIACLKYFFPHDVAGHSLRSGGATFLAECGAPPSLIQAAGRWTSEAWQAYIRKHPLLMNSLLFAQCPPALS
ncbi:unnamed protein product [Somion occarium]|uniref:Tyr recombinase domain-containing protein n=1 Tax=Somion occarium TaxID=3059160 RepID=A0ABP1DJK1_9APHY